MKWTRESLIFFAIFIIGLAVLIFSIYDIMLGKGLMIAVIVAYGVLIAFTIFLKFFRFRNKQLYYH